MERAAETNQGNNPSAQSAAADHSLAAALQHLVTGGQGVITKRIDLALLETKEFLGHLLERAALLVAALVLGAAAWLALAACIVILATPGGSLVVRLAAFGLLNAAVSAVCVMISRTWAEKTVGKTTHAIGNVPTLQPAEEQS